MSHNQKESILQVIKNTENLALDKVKNCVKDHYKDTKNYEYVQDLIKLPFLQLEICSWFE